MGEAADTSARSVLDDWEIPEQFDLELLPCFFYKQVMPGGRGNETPMESFSVLDSEFESLFCELIPF